MECELAKQLVKSTRAKNPSRTSIRSLLWQRRNPLCYGRSKRLAHPLPRGRDPNRPGNDVPVYGIVNSHTAGPPRRAKSHRPLDLRKPEHWKWLRNMERDTLRPYHNQGRHVTSRTPRKARNPFGKYPRQTVPKHSRSMLKGRNQHCHNSHPPLDSSGYRIRLPRRVPSFRTTERDHVDHVLLHRAKAEQKMVGLRQKGQFTRQAPATTRARARLLLRRLSRHQKYASPLPRGRPTSRIRWRSLPSLPKRNRQRKSLPITSPLPSHFSNAHGEG